MTLPRIAIVEDNRDNRMLLQALLSHSYELDEYATGRDALAGLRQKRPDLVLLDISLPGMDGVEVLRRIRDEGSLQDLPVIAITAHAMSGDRERYLASGFDGYVSKPIVDDSALLRTIQQCLDASRTSGGSRRAT